MANNRKKTIVEEIVVNESAIQNTIEEPVNESNISNITEESADENATNEVVKEENINVVDEEATNEVIKESDPVVTGDDEEINESDEGKIEDSNDEGEPEKIDEDIIVEDEPEIIQVVKVPTQDDTIVYEQKGICKVVLATPSYYIINKNGSNITIYGKNDKKRGDTVEY